MGHTSGHGVATVVSASISLVIVLSLTACGRVGYSSVSGLEDPDAGGGSADTGAARSPLDNSTDAGTARDAGSTNGPIGDAGGADLDAGQGADAGPSPDASSGVDAGMPDAGMPDAGMPDAGMPDAGMPDAGTVEQGCAALAGALACEDFESGNPALPWGRTGVGTFSRIREASARGEFVGRFRAAPGTQAAYVQSVAPLRNGDDIYMRAFVRVNADSAASWNVLLQAEAASFSAKTSLDFTENADLYATRSSTAFVSAAFPTRRWTCIEAHFFLSTSAGRIDVTVDGATVGQRSGVNTGVPAEGLENLFFGIISDSGNASTLEVDYDDVVFSQRPIDC